VLQSAASAWGMIVMAMALLAGGSIALLRRLAIPVPLRDRAR
jgi:hypothetical protein